MADRDLIHKRLIELYNHKEQWVDPYDTEDYTNRYIKKLIKVLLYFVPNLFYKIKLLRTHIWSENLELLGKSFLKIGDIKNAEQIYFDLLDMSKGNYYWGLPIGWKSGKYMFPKDSMMSTTTSEIALFFVELRRFSDVVEDDVLLKIASNLLEGLKKVYEDENKLILGYTAFDDYKINNSNLLVAAALHEIGRTINDSNIVNASIKITNACVDGISSNGGVPYFMNGNRYDSYHQVFSLRALYYMKSESTEFKKTYDKALKFLIKDLMDTEGNVYLSPKKNIIDMQGAAEVLNFLNLIKEDELGMKVLKQIESVLKTTTGKYTQRCWITRFRFLIKSKTIFTRQGELRLLLGKINYIHSSIT